MSEVIVRPYNQADIDSMIVVFHDSVRQIASRDYSETQVQAWAPDEIDRVAFAEKRASKPTWVACAGGKIIGFTDMEADGHLNVMYVHPGYQNCGVATALLSKVEAEARTQGINRIYTEASITAQPFFLQRGFRTITEQTVTSRGQDFLNYRMEKLLSNEGG